MFMDTPDLKLYTVVYRNPFSHRSDSLATMTFKVPSIESALFAFAELHQYSTNSVDCVLSGHFSFPKNENESPVYSFCDTSNNVKMEDLRLLERYDIHPDEE